MIGTRFSVAGGRNDGRYVGGRPALATSQAKLLSIPGGQGTVMSNAWRTTGNDSLKNSASINVSVNSSDVSVGSGSSWKNISANPNYWENSNGAKSSSRRSNIVVAPQQYYLKETLYIANTALVKLSRDTRTFQINASA